VQALARLHLFDAAVAAFAAGATREGTRAARQLGSAGTWPGQAPPADIVLALARRIRATELDDLQLESVTTAAAAVVPALAGGAAIAPAGKYGAAEVLSAMAAGYDVMHGLAQPRRGRTGRRRDCRPAARPERGRDRPRHRARAAVDAPLAARER
jgi:2-methylcitrate dehydratase PrpD